MNSRKDYADHEVDWIYVFGDVAGVGGSETRMAEAASVVTQSGGRVAAIVGSGDPSTPLTRLLESHGVRVFRRQSLVRFVQLLRATPNATIFTFGIRPSLAVRALRALLISRHATYMLRNGLDQGWSENVHRVDRWTSWAHDGYLVNSSAVKEHLVRHGARTEHVDIVEGALSAVWGAAAVTAPQRVPVVAMIGNQRPEKNQAFGLQVFAELPSGTATLKVYTDDAATLIAAAARQGIGDVEVIEGRRLGPGDYDAIDVVLMPSTSESVPRVLLEARARGCHVVTSNAGASAEVVDPARSTVVRGFELEHWATALSDSIKQSRDIPRGRPVLGRTTRDYVVDVVTTTSRTRLAKRNRP